MTTGTGSADSRRMAHIVAGCLLLAAPCAFAQVYKCADGGRIAFSDRPCADGAGTKMKTGWLPPESDIKFDVVTTYYSLSGGNYAQVFRALVSQNPEGFAAWARWKVDYNFDTMPRGQGCSIDRVHINITGQMMMPRWETIGNVTPRDQDSWQRMYEVLKRHEEGHIQHGREFALLLREKLLGIGTVPCDTIVAQSRKTYQSLYTGLQNRDAEYDRSTDHGRRQDNPQ